MRRSATVTDAGNPLRPCLARYLTVGYVPQDACPSRGSVSITQEYAYADHAIAGWRRGWASRRPRRVRAPLAHLPPAVRRRHRLTAAPPADGAWMSPFDPLCCALGNGKYQGPGYVEGTAWQYLFMVPHDIAGLMACWAAALHSWPS